METVETMLRVSGLLRSGVTSVTEQKLWHAGFANAATELGLPIRVDMSLPSDTLASTLYASHTVGRCM